MKAVLVKEFGPPSSLVVEEVARPTPGESEILIAVHAAGLNFPDTLMIAGKYQVKPSLPFSPGMECSGVVEGVGPGVSRFKPGDRVMAMTGFGSMADFVVAHETLTIRLPDDMSFEQGAAFPVTYGTTYHALLDRGRLKAGETLLVNGAAGGVGLNAVEIGKRVGATVIACASSREKLTLAKRYGADFLIDYASENVRDAVKRITEARGVDVIFDPVGGDASEQSLRSLAWGGRMLVIGFASGTIQNFAANMILLKNCDVVGVYWEAFAKRDPKGNRRNFETMFDWFRQGQLAPHIHETFPMDRVPAAMEALLSRRSSGKSIISVTSG